MWVDSACLEEPRRQLVECTCTHRQKPLAGPLVYTLPISMQNLKIWSPYYNTCTHTHAWYTVMNIINSTRYFPICFISISSGENSRFLAMALAVDAFSMYSFYRHCFHRWFSLGTVATNRRAGLSLGLRAVQRARQLSWTKGWQDSKHSAFIRTTYIYICIYTYIIYIYRCITCTYYKYKTHYVHRPSFI